MNDRLLKESDVIEAFKGRESLIHDVYTATAIIKSVPTADRQQGEWIDNGWHGDWQFETDGRGNCWKAFICSNCNTTSKAQTNFCPNCGARMKGADDE